MRTYNPDRWVVVEFDSPNHETIRKVLASWYGGFANGDSWKLSSGITSVDYEGDLIHFHNHSGSVYTVHKESTGMSSYTSGVYQNWVTEAKKMNGVNLKLVTEEYIKDGKKD